MCCGLHADSDDAKRKRRERRAAMLSLLLFSPWKKLRPNIAMASHALGNYFDAVDLAMETGTISTALKSGVPIVGSMTCLIRASMIGGYQDAGHLIGRTPGNRMIARAESLAKQRAELVSGQMLKTSKRWLKANPSSDFALSSARAERAARFEAAQAYYDGMHQVLNGQDMLKSWFTTSDDPCEECLENEDEGPIPMEETFPSGDDAPLAHLNCFAGSVGVLASGTSRMYRRRFHGKVVVIDVPGYGEILCTPNHPILTRRGWVSAVELQQGDDLVQCIDEAAFKRLTARINPDDKQIESTFEDCFSAAEMTMHMRRVRVPSTAEEFHGDAGVDHEVDIVDVDSFLPDELHLMELEEGTEFGFVGRLDRGSLSAFMGLRALSDFIGRAFRSAYRIVGGFGHVFAFCFRSALPCYSLGVTSVTDRETDARESILKDGTGYAEARCDVLDCLASCMRFVKPAHLRVVEDWSSHVYNLETRNGWYLAGSIVAHNCECILSVSRTGE
jgi:hypothetical protein